VFTTFSDPSLRAGYPKRMGTGGEAPIRYADLNGDNVPELIVPTEDGTIHAYEPNGSGLPGCPVLTQAQTAATSHEQGPALTAVASLEGYDKPPDIVAPSLDGHLYAFRSDGTPVPGYPVALVDPGLSADEQMVAESINQPAVGNLTPSDLHPHDSVVVATNESYGAPPAGSDVSFGGILGGAAGGSTRVYAVKGTGLPAGDPNLADAFLPGWPIHISGAIQNV